jgi:thioredoxin
MRKIVLLMLICVFAAGARGEGIRFFKGSFQEALKQAKAENKKVFVDFYTTWCGPCQLMSKNVFPDDEVGAYFNEHFINYKINAEDKVYLPEVKRYGVTAYPNMLILDAAGNVLGRQLGATDKNGFLRFAKLALKEVLPVDQLYEKLKKDKKNQLLMQDILLEAPDYIARQSGQDRDKWEYRIEKLYADYRKQRPLEDCITANDLKIFSIYHTGMEKKDEVFEFVLAHYDDYARVIDRNEVSNFLFMLSYPRMEELAKNGDMSYEKELERVRGDLKIVYDSIMNFGGMDTYSGLKLLFDAEYYLYSKKDVDKYRSYMEKYFAGLGEGIRPQDYIGALESLYEVLGEKITPEVAQQGISWLNEALKTKLQPETQMRCLLMLGDCYKASGSKEDAKKCYDQAYVVSLQFNNPGLSAAVQEYLKKLEE